MNPGLWSGFFYVVGLHSGNFGLGNRGRTGAIASWDGRELFGDGTDVLEHLHKIFLFHSCYFLKYSWLHFGWEHSVNVGLTNFFIKPLRPVQIITYLDQL
jgi:hypothetical protein